VSNSCPTGVRDEKALFFPRSEPGVAGRWVADISTRGVVVMLVLKFAVQHQELLAPPWMCDAKRLCEV
jgi:hypothetical protein